MSQRASPSTSPSATPEPLRKTVFVLSRNSGRELEKFIPVGQQLYAEAVKHELTITGPIQWHYHNFVSPEAPFDLEVCLPVAEVPQEYDGQFHVKRTDAFKSVSTVHEGSWYRIPETYKAIAMYAAANNLRLSTSSREVYINVDLADEQGNVTEIQYGLNQ